MTWRWYNFAGVSFIFTFAFQKYSDTKILSTNNKPDGPSQHAVEDGSDRHIGAEFRPRDERSDVTRRRASDHFRLSGLAQALQQKVEKGVCQSGRESTDVEENEL